MERRPLPPLPQKQVSPQTPHQTSMVQKQISSTVTSYTSGGSGDLTQDYDSTPKADYYADQLRAQARRLSQNQPTMLNAARYQSKPLPEMKTNIIKSRPVDGQPRPQEARPISAASATSSGGSVHSPTSPQELSPQSSSAQLPPTLYRTSEFGSRTQLYRNHNRKWCSVFVVRLSHIPLLLLSGQLFPLSVICTGFQCKPQKQKWLFVFKWQHHTNHITRETPPRLSERPSHDIACC